jgi:hypothetical protein
VSAITGNPTGTLAFDANTTFTAAQEANFPQVWNSTNQQAAAMAAGVALGDDLLSVVLSASSAPSQVYFTISSPLLTLNSDATVCHTVQPGVVLRKMLAPAAETGSAVINNVTQIGNVQQPVVGAALVANSNNVYKAVPSIQVRARHHQQCMQIRMRTGFPPSSRLTIMQSQSSRY